MNRNLILKVTFFAFLLVLALSSFTLAEDPPLACFTADILTGNIPLVVTFIDASEGEITAWEWSFGDESPVSYEQNPIHTYTSPGTYTITLTIYGPGGTATATSEVVAHAPLVASFSKVSTPGEFPLEVRFTDESTGDIVEWAWDFGDGSPICYEQHPIHYYTQVGDYCITLTVKDSKNEEATAAAEEKVEEVWTPNSSGILVGPNDAWKVALVSVGFKSVEPNNWHKINRDKGSQDVYTDDPFTNPQWQDNTKNDPNQKWPDGDAEDYITNSTTQPEKDHKYPICFSSTATMRIKLTLITEGSVTIEAYQGFEPERTGEKKKKGYHFPESTSTTIDCSQEFPINKVQYFEEFKFQWLVKINGKWGKLAYTTNQCYVTRQEPYLTPTYISVDPNSPDYLLPGEPKLFHTVLHVACNRAGNFSYVPTIVEKIYENFEGKRIERAEDKYQAPYTSVLLKYYDPWSTNVDYTQGVISETTGTSMGWSKFFVDVLKIHRLVNPGEYHVCTVVPYLETYMLVKNWTFSETPVSLVPYYPYSNVYELGVYGSSTAEKQYLWSYMDVVDEIDGAETQGGNLNPPTKLTEFTMVVYQYNMLFNPAYGTGPFQHLNAFEYSLMAGWGIDATMNVNEELLDPPNGFDADNNGKIDEGIYDVMLCKKEDLGTRLNTFQYLPY